MKKLLLSLLALCALFCAMGQTNDPAILSTGPKLPARSFLTPFANDAEVKSGASSYVVSVGEWTWRQTADGISFTSRFKRPGSWEGRSTIVRIIGASSSFAVDINGIRVGYSQWGAGRTEFDISRFVREFYNDITVTIYSGSVAEQLEMGRSHAEAGFESVEVISQPIVRVDDILADATVVGSTGRFELRLAMQSASLNRRGYTLQYELAAPGGKVVAKGETAINLAPMQGDTATFRIANVERVEMWSAVSPKLYTLTVRTLYENKMAEIITRQIGFTDFGFSREGYFSVGGKAVQLIAVRVGQGSMASIEAELRRAKTLRANTVIIEYPQRDEFYELCDRVGMYIIDRADICTGTVEPNVSNDPRWLGAFTERIVGTWRMSRLHPSVVAYISAAGSAYGYCIAESYLTYKRLEHHRPLIYPEAGQEWASDAIVLSILVMSQQ